MSQQTFVCKDLTGNTVTLLSMEEKEMYDKAQAKYNSEFTFDIASDLRTIDRLVMMEVMAFRWSSQILSGVDYIGRTLSPAVLANHQKFLKEAHVTIGKLMEELGLTKNQRDKENADTVQAYIDNLLTRAEEFGIHRETQAEVSLELMNEIIGVVGAYLRSNEFERRQLGFPDAESVVKWIARDIEPKFKEVDDHFRNNSQKYWIKDI
jgi:hypothetical protein